MNFRLLALAIGGLVTISHAFAVNDNYFPPPNVDDPDLLDFIDSNGDGSFGMKYGPIYVSPAGSDSNFGTIDAPMKTIQAACLAAKLLGRPVYMMAGTYPEAVSFLEGSKVFGGFTASWSLDPAHLFTTIQSPFSVGSYVPVLNNDILMMRMKINAAYGASPGHHSIGLWSDHVPDSSAYMQLVFITAGNGANGSPGGDGLQGVTPGDADGGDTGAQGGGFGLGALVNYGASGGNGGTGGQSASIDGTPGIVGNGSSPGTPGSKGNSTTFSFTATDGGDGGKGGDGTNGQHGFFVSDPFFTISTNATSGTSGSGGGGGGGGGAVGSSKGGGGGGGGAGGRISKPPANGMRGGHSIAMYHRFKPETLVSGGPFMLPFLVRGSGGNGGVGGDGVLGGLGGDPGLGGLGAGSAKKGGNGGPGGKAGATGSGAGGSGGNSFFLVTGGQLTGYQHSVSGGTSVGGPGGTGPLGTAPAGAAGGTVQQLNLNADGPILANNMPVMLGVHGRAVFSDQPGLFKNIPVLAATFPESSPWTLQSISPSAHGTITLGATTFNFSSTGGFVGTEVLDVVAKHTGSAATVSGKILMTFRKSTTLTINFEGYTTQIPTPGGVMVEVLDGDGLVMEAQPFIRNAGVDYQGFLSDTAVGKRLRIKYFTFLSQERVYNGANLNYSLRNGDCNGDDTVGTDDYLILNSAFDTSEEDANYEITADLNQDRSVGTDDYLLLNNNFDLSGPIG